METDETAVSESYRVSQTVNPLFLEERLEVSKRSAPASVLNCGLNSNISFDKEPSFKQVFSVNYSTDLCQTLKQGKKQTQN